MSLSSPASSRTPGYPVLRKDSGATSCQHVNFFRLYYSYEAFSWPFWQRISCSVCKEEEDQFIFSLLCYLYLQAFRNLKIPVDLQCYSSCAVENLAPERACGANFLRRAPKKAAVWRPGRIPLRWLVGSHRATWGVETNKQPNQFKRLHSNFKYNLNLKNPQICRNWLLLVQWFTMFQACPFKPISCHFPSTFAIQEVIVMTELSHIHLMPILGLMQPSAIFGKLPTWLKPGKKLERIAPKHKFKVHQGEYIPRPNISRQSPAASSLDTWHFVSNSPFKGVHHASK